ncbi:BAHD acyltransferase DCR [Vigna radiata var. radiata]|uniref:BAHD acyltransferase DCR n=1 Tax=Vigna radiata var. radiata TaxID=3916 RepID=A0A1S3VEK7_VIGRR|nr:BAHD acyltransferase DCR [Vigna radiata var. radiata]
MPSSSTTIVSRCLVHPDHKSTIKPLKLSVSDLPMLSCHYIQKGVLLTAPTSSQDLILSLKHSLSAALSHFPALAGRLSTDYQGYVHIDCNDAGVDFIHAKAKHLTLNAVVSPTLVDVHPCFKEFFAYDMMISYAGHHNPLAAIQVTELADAVFVGCTVNHAVTDGTSFWHFFNTFAAINKGGAAKKVLRAPDFTRETVINSDAVLFVPAGGPALTFDAKAPIRERIFHFSRESIQKLKLRANAKSNELTEVMEKQVNDGWNIVNGKVIGKDNGNGRNEISSFQSLSAQLWRAVTRARKFNDPAKTSTFRMAVNFRHRLEPKMDPFYFGNAIQSIPTVATVRDILSHDLRFCAELLHRNVIAHDDATVRRGIEDWENAPRLFPLGNFDGAMITMGSSPRFPMYDNDFGWGRPVAIRSGKANKFDGKISAFPGREGNGSVDLEVVLAPETMAGLENDMEFMQYVTQVV